MNERRSLQLLAKKYSLINLKEIALAKDPDENLFTKAITILKYFYAQDYLTEIIRELGDDQVVSIIDGCKTIQDCFNAYKTLRVIRSDTPYQMFVTMVDKK